ncbi:MAG: acyltransferase [Cyanobacteria bacterium P01_D01_bin.44]
MVSLNQIKTAHKTAHKPAQKLTLLECLRGLAALLIVAFHATELFALKFDHPFLLSLFQFGDAGVDFFFVLSGFFLALSSFKYIGHSGKVKGFLLKRCARLYPFYWFVTIGLIPIYFLVPSFGKGHEREMGSILKSLLLIPQSHAPIVSVAWFLSHLMFFYLAFAAVIWAPKLFSKVVFVGLSLSAIFMLADVISGFQLRDKTHFLIDFIFSYYNLEFAAGCLIGVFFTKIQMREAVSRCLLWLGCLAFLIAGFVDVYVLQLEPGNAAASHYYEFIAYGLSSVLIVTGAAFLEKRHEVQINQAFVVLGAASFSIYLTHYPILSIFTKAIQVTGISGFVFYTLAMVLACIATVWMGCIAHFYVEKRLVSLFKARLIYKKI